MNDVVVLAGVIVSFAIAVTAHVTIVFGLATRPPRWRAAVALFVFPAGVWWAYREKMTVRAIVLVAGVVAYVLARLLA